MKILLTVILLLFSHLAYAADIVNLSSATRTKSVNATVGLSSAARGGGGGGGGYAADAWADYWTFDGSDWLSCAHDAALQQVGSGSMAAVVGIMRDDHNSNMDWASKGNNVSGQYGWELFSGYYLYRQGRITFYSNGVTAAIEYENDSVFHSEKCTMGGNLVPDESYVNILFTAKQDGRTVQTCDGLGYLSLSTYESQFQIGSGFGNQNPAYGRIYFVAVYHSAQMTQANIEGIMDGTVHPADLSPSFYVDFSKDVAATYVSEIGDITLTVTGDPVKGP